MKLLFLLAEWHGLAKLKLHTDSTLQLLDQCTREFGACLRDFKNTTCAAYVTLELQREAEARERRVKRQAAKESASQKTSKKTSKKKSTGSAPSQQAGHRASQTVPSAPKQRRPKELNINTIKLHMLGDYVPTIRAYGTADSYNTQAVRFIPHNLPMSEY